jgi:hypothetical protein
MYLYTYTYIYTHTYIHTYVYTYIHAYEYTYMQTYIHFVLRIPLYRHESATRLRPGRKGSGKSATVLAKI